MSSPFDAKLGWLASLPDRRLLTGGLRGFEKECLRVDRDGRLAQTPHADEWGSALTHPYVTTDYSEALLEFVTPPESHPGAGIDLLSDLHAFVQRHAGSEMLWPASMPCTIESDDSVPIANYGSSNEGRLRSIYRSGLGFRYGRAMQAIAGTHFNFSLPESFWPEYRDYLGADTELQSFRSECLMGLVRNYRRIGWLVVYLFGASPAFSKSFRPAGHARLESLSADTWYAPYSTSLRMSDMGYRNSTQSRLSVSSNSLGQYLAELKLALTTREPRYEAIGVCVDGQYRQLNANLLQLENEYYSSIRPKPRSKNPRLIVALDRTGIDYVEVRTLDLNPFVRPGVTEAQARFLEVVLIWCLLATSDPISAAEQDEIDARELSVAWNGRKPGLRLARDGGEARLEDWAIGLLDELRELASLLDGAGRAYVDAVVAAREAVRDPSGTLSARVLDAITARGGSFFDWAFEIAAEHKAAFLRHRFPPGRLAELESLAVESLEQTRSLEAAEEVPFAEYLSDFLAIGLESRDPVEA